MKARILCAAMSTASLLTATEFLNWMDGIAQKHLKDRRETIAAIRDTAAAQSRQAATRAKYLELIGGLPQYKGPLNARVTGTIDEGSYLIEKVLYESLPRYFVTGNVYRPKAAGRYPAVLLSLGHWNEGKSATQMIAANLALNGFVVLAYDPMGQGERAQGYDKRFGVSLGTTDQHFLAGTQALLAGKTMASYMIHDAKRSLDYLTSRPDVDSDRIGATGCSGGGTLTTFISALDPRVKVAAPACYITSFELLFTGSVGDSEQSTPGFLSSGLDQADFIEMFAPKPWLILSTKEDFFPLEGARRTFEEAKRWYRIFGAEERVGWIVGPGGHGTPVEVREGIYSWMSRWLKNAAETIKEQPVKMRPDHDLWATSTGQVGDMKDVRDLWEVIKGEYHPPTGVDAGAAVRAMISPAKDPKWRKIADEPEPRFKRELIAISVEPGLEIDGTLLVPAGNEKRTAVVVVEMGSKLSELATQLAEAGAIVLALRPRGVEDRDDRRQLLPDWLANTRAWLIGLNLPTLRARDVLSGVALLSARDDVREVVGVAKGSAGVWMLMAAAADPKLARVWVDGTPHSFRAALNGPVHRSLHDALIPGVQWDLDDLVRSIGTDRVLWSDPTNWVYKTPLKGPFVYRGFEEGNGLFIRRLLKQ